MGVLTVVTRGRLMQPSGVRWVMRVFGMLAFPVLAGCDQLGIDTPAKIEERVVAESKAIGSACRHAMRAIEDCYAMNPKAQKAAIAGGWREMDEYMRENKLEGVTPTIAKAVPGRTGKSQDSEEEDVATEEESNPSNDAAASKAHADTGHQTEQGKAGKSGAPAADGDKAGKADKAVRGADSKSKRDKQDTLHAEAGASQPH